MLIGCERARLTYRRKRGVGTGNLVVTPVSEVNRRPGLRRTSDTGVGGWRASVGSGHISQSIQRILRQLLLADAPSPVAVAGAGGVHACLAAEAEHILQRGDRAVGDG